MTLPALVQAQPRIFEILARAWVDQGASAFSVWDDRQSLLACWPENYSARARAEQALFTTPIALDELSNGEIRVHSMQSIDHGHAEQRLRADAALIARFLPLARDLDLLAAELVQTRDQLLAVYHLANSGRSCLEAGSYLNNLVAQLPRMGRAEAAFAILEVPNNPVMVRQHPRPILDDAILVKLSEQAGREDHKLMGEADLEGLPEVKDLLLMQVDVRGATRAAIGLINKRGGSFMMPDIKLLRSIGAYAGAEIENVLMFQENVRLARLETEMTLAQRVQFSLLPKEPPSVPGLAIAAAAVPASIVGGDFYDFIVRPNLPFTFAVGDLSGKGFPAALLMSMTRTSLRSEAVGAASPEEILHGMNHELYEDFTRLSSFATLFVGQYFPNGHKLRYANAGHSPVIYCPAGQPAQLLMADGTALGILAETESDDQSLDFLPGDVLLIGTDGLAEARSPGGQRFGYERLVELVGELAGLPAKEIASRVFQTVAAFRQAAAQDDDQTLVILKCLNPSQTNLSA